MKKKEVRGFQSEVQQLLKLMIHSLYSNKEIFLRELISNASDASEKLRFRALSNPDLYEGDSELKIRISIDKNRKTLTISDNAIGMTRTEVIENLGTIAKSGTRDFLSSLGEEQKIKDDRLIGQFGVGFYSSFIVAKKVSVYTRLAGASAKDGVFWESTGKDEYIVENIIKDVRGTKIVLHLREGNDEFLDTSNLCFLIKKYSDHIAFPVEISKNIKNSPVWETINKAQAIWIRDKKDVTFEEYKEFYKYISHNYDDPLIWSHNKVEGNQEYVSLLYIPSKANFDLWNRENNCGLKLYVRRVFVMNKVDKLIPNYLRFVCGLVNSDNLPLNVSREILQDNHLVKNLRNSLTKRVLKMLRNLSEEEPEKYKIFWKEFGLVLKEALVDNISNKQEIAKLLRFSSTINKNDSQDVSLEEYIHRMKDGQKKIYYITADNYSLAKNSPHLELFYKKNIEVLLLFDRIDEWMISNLSEFSGKNFQSITKEDSSLEDVFLKRKIQNIGGINKELNFFIKKVKEILGEKIKEVKLSSRLIESPVILTTDINEMSTQMAKIFSSVGKKINKVKYNFEINSDHKLIKKIINLIDDKSFTEWINFLFEQALFIEQGSLEDPNQFVRRINKFLS